MTFASVSYGRLSAGLALLVGALLPACRSDPLPVEPLCRYAGRTYPVGASFPASDGCNSCTCGSGGSIGCTEKGCSDAGPRINPDSALPRDVAPPRDTPPQGVADASGDVGCAEIACQPRDAATGTDAVLACDFTTRYDYGQIGGLRIFTERSELAPGGKYTHTRTQLAGPGPNLSCSPPLPACGTAGVITALDIEARALAHPDVRAALSETTPPLYGRDSRPVDGTVFEFKRSDGRGFLVGASCTGIRPCRDIPTGITELTRLLQDLDRQQLRAPECNAFRPRI